MKSTPPPFGRAPETNSLFSKSELYRLVFLSVVLVMVGVAFVAALRQTSTPKDATNRDLPGEEAGFSEEIVLKEFDPSLVAGKVADEKPGDRVLLESGPFDAMFRYAVEIGPVHFRALDPRELDARLYEEIAAQPEQHRARPFRARGHVQQLESRTRPDGLAEHRGWLRLEDGRAVHFAVAALPENTIQDDFVRIDGLFLKLYNDEGPSGWVEGPLLVGAGAVRSYATPEAVDAKTLQAQLSATPDDDVNEHIELAGDAFEGYWLLMTHVRQLASGDADWMLAVPEERPGLSRKQIDDLLIEHGVLALEPRAVDWSKVPELDNKMLADLLKDGKKHRGQPFRIGVSRNMDSYTMDPGENPARVDRVTEGWIGNTTWTAQAGLVKFQMPRAASELENARFVTGRGYFLKNLAYSPERGGLNIVPFFVMVSVEPFVPKEDRSVQTLLLGAIGVTLLLAIVIPVLVFRDRRKARALQDELIRRRRARRTRADGASQPSSSS